MSPPTTPLSRQLWPWPEAAVVGGGIVRPLARSEAGDACQSCAPAPRADEALAASTPPLQQPIAVHRGGMAVGITVHAGALRDLAAGHVGQGDRATARREHGDALNHYRTAAAIMQRLAAADVDNIAFLRDVSVCWNRIAAVLSASGDHTEATNHYRRSLGLLQRLIVMAPHHPDLPRDLAWCRAQLANRI